MTETNNNIYSCIENALLILLLSGLNSQVAVIEVLLNGKLRMDNNAKENRHSLVFHMTESY